MNSKLAPAMVNIAQSSESHEITKNVGRQSRNPNFTDPRRNMKTSTKDKIKGSFHEMKGAIKEEVGKVTNDPKLKAAGRTEKNAGKIQQKISHAKEAVAKLKEKLAETKKAG
jgi:uncharacterized protein YjbJ (UPF0337 family)